MPYSAAPCHNGPVQGSLNGQGQLPAMQLSVDATQQVPPSFYGALNGSRSGPALPQQARLPARPGHALAVRPFLRHNQGSLTQLVAPASVWCAP